MDSNEYLFSDVENQKSKKKDNATDTLLEHRADDALLHALSLVLSSNSEYARSIHSLLETDLNNGHTINEVDNKVRELLEQTEKLIDSQDALSILLTTFNSEYKDVVQTAMIRSNEKQQEYMNSKFSFLFLSLGLKSDGTEYSPVDRFFIRLKTTLSNQLWLLFVGIILYHIALTVVKRYLGGE